MFPSEGNLSFENQKELQNLMSDIYFHYKIVHYDTT